MENIVVGICILKQSCEHKLTINIMVYQSYLQKEFDYLSGMPERELKLMNVVTGRH